MRVRGHGTALLVDLPDALNCWNEEISDWIAPNGVPSQDLQAIIDACANPQNIQLEALPEPYVGDPTSKALRAVLLTLNPGRADPEQEQGGPFWARVEEEGYRAVAQRWDFAGGPHGVTARWWRDRRGNWVSRLLNLRPSFPPSHIAGFDLFPFHSVGYRDVGLPMTAPVIDWVRSHVIEPAAWAAIPLASRAGTIRYRDRSKNCHFPLLAAFGSDYETVFNRSCDLVYSIDAARAKQMGGVIGGHSWPISQVTGRLVARRFSLYRGTLNKGDSETVFYALVMVVARSGPPPPADTFDGIVGEILDGWLP